MRQKKHKRVSRSVRFLKLAFDFRTPYKVGLWHLHELVATGLITSRAADKLPAHAGDTGRQLCARPAAVRVCLGSPPPLSSGCYERRLLSLVSSRTATACRTQPADAVPKLLGGACKLCTSRCVLEELRRLGAQCEGAR